MKKVCRVIGFWVVMLLSGVASAASAENPLLHVAAVALRDNPQVVSSRASLASAQEQVDQALAALLPSINFSASKTTNRVEWEDNGNSTNDPLSMGLSLSQSIYDGAALTAYRQTRPYVKAYAQDLSWIQQSVLLSVLEAAVNVLQAAEVLQTEERHVEVIGRHLEATQARFAVGEITRTDVSQAEARLASAEAARITAWSDLESQQALFLEVTGSAPPEGMALPPVELPAAGMKFKQLEAKLDGRADIEASRLRLNVAEANIKMQRAGHLPTVALSGSGSRNWSEQTSGRPDPVDKYALALTVTVPIFAGGATVSQVREARSDRDAQGAALDLLRRQARRQLRQAIAGHQSAAASLKAFEAVSSAAREALTGVNQEFQVGARTSLDVLDAQDELFSAETDLAKSRYSVVLARYTLLNALGDLTLPALGGRMIGAEGGTVDQGTEAESHLDRIQYIETAPPSVGPNGG
ncbi:MAG: TolC family outer membrane protein [Magnetococcales bacterium]|nr:TolC family outer membrane protein [Magnetococcales bacterium]